MDFIPHTTIHKIMELDIFVSVYIQPLICILGFENLIELDYVGIPVRALFGCNLGRPDGLYIELYARICFDPLVINLDSPIGVLSWIAVAIDSQIEYNNSIVIAVLMEQVLKYTGELTALVIYDAG